MRVGLVILPTDRWPEARRQWEWADGVGFHAAWTYDHVRWGGMPDGPWLAAVPVLAAASVVTTSIRLGTLVATPNFRHPVPLARDAIALDDLSSGRIDLGVGPGSEGPDATAVGGRPWSTSERIERFAEFLQILRAVLGGAPTDRTSLSLTHYACSDAPSTPGTVQSPLPLTVAAGGPRAMRLAAEFGQQWVTIGRPRVRETADSLLTSVRDQCELLDSTCGALGRAPSSLAKVLLWTPTEPAIDSADHFDELAAPYAALGFDQLVLHHPAQTGPYRGSVRAFETIAARYADPGPS